MTRVPQLALTGNFLRNVNGLALRLQRDQIRLASGFNYQRPSDGPLAVGQILGYRVEISRLTQLRRNISDGNAQVSFLDGKLQGLIETIRESRTRVLEGVNGSFSREDRRAIAQQLDQDLLELIATGNTDFNGRYLFAGTNTRAEPFETFVNPIDGLVSDVRYDGNQRDIARRIGTGSRYDINFTGDELFLEQTETVVGKVLPTNEPLGFEGTLVINEVEITIGPKDTLQDIATRINLAPELGASARVRNNSLQIFSDYAIRGVDLADRSGGDLLTDLGINLRGPYTRALGVIPALSLPLTDSTPAIVTAAGPVASLIIDGDNDILNVHLGASANEGTPVSHTIRIPHGVYATASDLADAIQTEADRTFGFGRLVVTDVAGALQIATAKNGAPIGVTDLQIGGVVDGVQDTASDNATLNLVGAPGPTPITNASIAGTDGNDRFAIDLGALLTPTGTDQPPIEIDLEGANTGGLSALVQEINAQIRADVRLRGAVEAAAVDGRLEIRAINAGRHIPPTELALVDTIPGVLATLGDFSSQPARLFSGVSLSVPVSVTTANQDLLIDLGPSISRSGVDSEPITIRIPTGSYATSAALVAALNLAISQQGELDGQVQFVPQTLAANSPIELQTVNTGSQYRGEDLALSGPLLADLGLASTATLDGAGVAPGEGGALESRNLIRDLIALRDDITDIADGEAIAKELTTADGTFIGLFDGDDITVRVEGVDYTFQHRAGETLESLVAEFNRILGGRVEFEITREGRVSAHNNESTPVFDFSITARDPFGAARTVFNQVFSELGNTLPGLGDSRTGVMLDPQRRDRAAQDNLANLDLDMETNLAIEALVGARANRLSFTDQVIERSASQLNEQKTGLESVNIVEVITRMQAEQTTLEAALSIGARILPSSLISYLR